MNVKWRYWIALPDFIYGNKLMIFLRLHEKLAKDLTS